MDRLHVVVDLLDDQRDPRVTPGSPADDALLTLLSHMALRDDAFDDREVEMLAAVLPQWNATSLRAWLGRVASQPLDLYAIADKLDTDDLRWLAMRYCARMALADDHLDPEERSLLEAMSRVLHLPPSSVDQVLDEVRQLRPPTREAIEAALAHAGWDAPVFADGPVQSQDLLRVLPPGLTPIQRVGVDGAEVLGLYVEGLVGRFLEGVAFLPWTDIVTTSQGKGLASSVRLHTQDGQIFSLVDGRLSGITRILQRLRPERRRRPGASPLIERGGTPSPTEQG